MELIKHKGLIWPKHAKDQALFKHCAGGSTKVTTRLFNAEVQPLLFMHGVKSISTAPLKGKD